MEWLGGKFWATFWGSFHEELTGSGFLGVWSMDVIEGWFNRHGDFFCVMLVWAVLSVSSDDIC